MLCEWARNAVRATGVRRVVAAGGVFMNVKANKRIGELAEVDSFEAFPSCSDETLSLGAYYFEAAGKRFGDAGAVPPLDSTSISATNPDEAETDAAVKQSGLSCHRPADIAGAPWPNCWPRASRSPAAPVRWSLARGPLAIARSWPIRATRTLCA